MPFRFRGGEAGKTEAKGRHEGTGTLLLPAETTEIPVGTVLQVNTAGMD